MLLGRTSPPPRWRTQAHDLAQLKHTSELLLKPIRMTSKSACSARQASGSALDTSGSRPSPARSVLQHSSRESLPIMPTTATHHDVNDVRPSVIDKFVGQSYLIERIRVALEAAWTDATRLPHMLFVGSSGLGKTNLCELIAREMGCEKLVQQLGQNLNCPANLHGFLLQGDDRGVLFIDECHELVPPAQTRE